MCLTHDPVKRNSNLLILCQLRQHVNQWIKFPYTGNKNQQMPKINKIVNHSHCQNTTHCLCGIKIWEAKFSLGRRSQDIGEGKKRNFAEGEERG